MGVSLPVMILKEKIESLEKTQKVKKEKPIKIKKVKEIKAKKEKPIKVVKEKPVIEKLKPEININDINIKEEKLIEKNIISEQKTQEQVLIKDEKAKAKEEKLRLKNEKARLKEEKELAKYEKQMAEIEKKKLIKEEAEKKKKEKYDEKIKKAEEKQKKKEIAQELKDQQALLKAEKELELLEKKQAEIMAAPKKENPLRKLFKPNLSKEEAKKRKEEIKNEKRKLKEKNTYINENAHIEKKKLGDHINDGLEKLISVPKKLYELEKKKIKNNAILKNKRNEALMHKESLLIDFEGDDAKKSDKKVVYEYVGKNAEGKIIKAYFDAYSKVEVHSFLLSEGFEVYSIKTNSLIQFLHGSTSKKTQKFKTKDLIFFLAQLSTYIKAGIPLVEALRILSRQFKDKRYEKIFKSIIYELTMGDNFSDAMAKQGDTFPRILVNMVKASEMTGVLPETLDDMQLYFDEMSAKQICVNGTQIGQNYTYIQTITAQTTPVTGVIRQVEFDVLAVEDGGDYVGIMLSSPDEKFYVNSNTTIRIT
jgi:hypothetical protein